jgi:hypothetical protein
LKITLSSSGSFDNTESFLKRIQNRSHYKALKGYGEKGIAVLSSATPIDSGETASSWSYKIVESDKRYSITWYNDHVVDGVPIAIILQYGHGTGTGGWVEGRDYINPALRPIFEQMAVELWKEVTRNG